MMTSLMLRLRRLRNYDGVSAAVALMRYSPYVLCVVCLKLYIITLLVSSRAGKEVGSRDDDDGSLDEERQVSTEEPGWREKMAVLGSLNESVLSPSAHNRTPQTIWLFFNRIPRTGSQTVVSLMQSLAPDLEYSHQEHIYRTPWQRLMSPVEQKNLATWFEYNFWPKSYDRYCMYINFTQHRSFYVTLRPAYITMVRDPVEKFISHFRHKRIDKERTRLEMNHWDSIKPGSGRDWYWKKLDDCVLKSDPECALAGADVEFSSSVPFLCGQYQECLEIGNKWALQMAKFNAEYEYAVIGAVEHMNTTLTVLEHYVPMFFRGAIQRYWSEGFQNKRYSNKNSKKYTPVPDSVVKVLKDKLALEYELYEFLLQRLHLQYQSIEPMTRSTTELIAKPTEKPELSAWDIFEIQMQPKLQ